MHISNTDSTLRTALCLGVLASGLTGCAMNSANFAVSAPAATAGYTLSGTVQTGSPVKAQRAGAHPDAAPPISGATVLLFAASVKGYGSQAQLLALTTTSADGRGNFQFTNDPTHVNALTNISATYSCPSYTFNSPDGTTSITADSLIYLIAIAGDTVDATGTAHNNKHSILMAALGDCQSLVGHEPSVIMNAVTTVASVYALAPYINPNYPDTTYNGTYGYFAGGGLGAATTYMTNYGTEVRGGYTATGSKKSVATLPLGYIGMRNAFSTVSRLVNLTTGSAVQSFTQTAAVTGGTVTVTGTPEFAKLNSLADAMTSCIYTSDDQYGNPSNACTTLFSYATGSGDTGTAYGPTANLPATSDTLQFAYYSAINPVGGQGFATPSSRVNGIYALATPTADFQPTITAAPTDWTLSITYNSTSTCGSSTTPAPFFSASPGYVSTDLSGGVTLANAAASANTLVALDNTGAPTSCQFGNLATPGGTALDAAGNAWLSVPSAATIYRSSAGLPLTVPTTGITPYGLAFDATGNLFTAGGTTGNIYTLPGAQTAVLAPTASPAFGYSFEPVYSLALDNAGDIYTVGNTNPGGALVALNTGGTYTVHAFTGSSTLLAPFAVAVDQYGGLVTASTAQSGVYNSDADYITYSASSGFTIYPGSSGSSGSPGGLSNATAVAVDGAGNMWFGNSQPAATYTSNAQTLNLFNVSEFRDKANPSSSVSNPSFVSGLGTACPTNQTTNCYNGGGYQKTSLGAARGIAVDISGNVWIPADLSSNGVANGNLVEIIGSAVPSVQPLAVAVRDNLVSTLLPE